MTREPVPTALELDRDDIAFSVIMSAPRFPIHFRADNVCATNHHVHDTRSRGHSSTSTAAIIQHTIIKMNPLAERTASLAQLPIIFGPTNPPMLCGAIDEPYRRGRGGAGKKGGGQRPKRGQIGNRAENRRGEDRNEHTGSNAE